MIIWCLLILLPLHQFPCLKPGLTAIPQLRSLNWHCPCQYWCFQMCTPELHSVWASVLDQRYFMLNKLEKQWTEQRPPFSLKSSSGLYIGNRQRVALKEHVLGRISQTDFCTAAFSYRALIVLCHTGWEMVICNQHMCWDRIENNLEKEDHSGIFSGVHRNCRSLCEEAGQAESG